MTIISLAITAVLLLIGFIYLNQYLTKKGIIFLATGRRLHNHFQFN